MAILDIVRKRAQVLVVVLSHPQTAYPVAVAIGRECSVLEQFYRRLPFAAALALESRMASAALQPYR